MAKLVSTIILNYNGRHLLGECLEAVLRQTYPNQEVIVVDNGSSDGSQALVRDRFPTVRLLELRENLGCPCGDNRGIAVARGEFIALLNDDAVPEPNWLEELCKAMEQNPRIGICTARQIFRGSDVLNEAGLSWTVWGHSRALGSGEPCADTCLEKREVFAAGSGATLYRGSMLDEIGLLDEDFVIYSEDVDLAFRAQLADYRCVYVPTAVVDHYCGATTGKNLHRRAFYTIRNGEFLLLKNMPGSLLWKYLGRHLFYFVVLNVICILRGYGAATLRANWQILCGVPHWLKKRKAIQQKRKTSLARLESLFEQETFWELWQRQRNRWRRKNAAKKQGGSGACIPPAGPAWD